MHRLARTATALGLVAIGYALGAAQLAGPGAAHGQQPQAEDPNMPSAPSIERIRAAAAAVDEAAESLQQESRYIPATDTPNTFAVLAGGVNAVDDLENGRGVDPVTFAGLYADMAVPQVAEHLARDEQGRLTYKGKVIRMYPVSRLRHMFGQQSRLRGEEE